VLRTNGTLSEQFQINQMVLELFSAILDYKMDLQTELYFGDTTGKTIQF
jgi:hypothetical protein